MDRNVSKASLLAFALLASLCHLPAQTGALGQNIAAAAESQVGKTLYYDSTYQRLPYPNGDVPLERGVCCDVVIRALRTAAGIDLQKNVHADMERHFSSYPQNWGLAGPDPNIDHRRVPNLEVYFRRMGCSLPVSQQAADYLPGDIVSCRLDNGLPHIMVVSSRKTPEGHPLMVHNIGAGARLEDVLFEFKLTGHFRIKQAGS